MHIAGVHIDSKFKKKKNSILNQQREFDCMIRDKNKGALVRFKEEPFQLRYMRIYEADRTEQQSKKNIDENNMNPEHWLFLEEDKYQIVFINKRKSRRRVIEKRR